MATFLCWGLFVGCSERLFAKALFYFYTLYNPRLLIECVRLESRPIRSTSHFRSFSFWYDRLYQPFLTLSLSLAPSHHAGLSASPMWRALLLLCTCSQAVLQQRSPSTVCAEHILKRSLSAFNLRLYVGVSGLFRWSLQWRLLLCRRVTE